MPKRWDKFIVFDTDDDEEREARRHMTPQQRKVMERYLRDGWEVTVKGKWAFLARKWGQPLRAVWVERKNADPSPKRSGLMRSQKIVMSVLQAKGIDCVVEEPD